MHLESHRNYFVLLDRRRSIVVRQIELAEQAANGVYTLEQRRALHLEADALNDEYNRIVEVAEFNGVELLNNAGSTLSIQAGYGSQGSISMTLGQELPERLEMELSKRD